MSEYKVLIDGKGDTRRLDLDTAAQLIAEAHREGRRFEAFTFNNRLCTTRYLNKTESKELMDRVVHFIRGGER